MPTPSDPNDPTAQIISLMNNPAMAEAARKLEERAKAAAEADEYSALCDNWMAPRFAVMGTEFWDGVDRQMLSEEEVNRHPEVVRRFGYKRDKADVAPTTMLLRSPARVQIKGLITLAGDASPVVQFEGQLFGNHWQGAGIAPAPNQGAGICYEFEQHIHWMVPNSFEADWLLDFLAWRYQFPGAYSPLMVVLAGNGRVGKDLTLGLYWRIVGKHNMRVTPLAMLSTVYNDYAAKPFCYVPEFTLGGPHGAAIYDNLKALTGAPATLVQINDKYRPLHMALVQPTFIMTTNADNALSHVHDYDARLAVIGCLASANAGASGPGSAAYFAGLAQLFEDPAYVARVARWLLDRDVSRFQPHVRPMTSMRAQLMAGALSPLAAQAYELVVSGALAGRHLFSSLELALLLPDRGNGYTAAAIGAGLRRAGCVRLGQFGAGAGRCSIYTGASVIGSGSAVLSGLSEADRDRYVAATSIIGEVPKLLKEEQDRLASIIL